MASLNIGEQLRGDPRFDTLVTLTSRQLAYGGICMLWELGQSYWKKNKALIPEHIGSRLPNIQELVETGFAVKKENGFYCAGAEERWGFLLAKSEAGKASAAARLEKHGSAIPFNASNRIRTAAEQPSEQKPSRLEQAEPSYSYSSSSSDYDSKKERGAGAPTQKSGPLYKSAADLKASLPILTAESFKQKYQDPAWVDREIDACFEFHSADPAQTPRTSGAWHRKLITWLKTGWEKANPPKGRKSTLAILMEKEN